MTGKQKHSKKRQADHAQAAALLDAVAAALNAAQAAGLKVRLKHDAVLTNAGYVLPVSDDRWGARTLTYSEFPPGDPDDEDE